MVEVSVVVPTHDRPELMKLAVESVLAQSSGVAGEIIIVFDACPIDVPTLDIPDGWSVRGIANARSRGLAGARKSGIDAAQGRLIAFLDDDDEWLPEPVPAGQSRWSGADDRRELQAEQDEDRAVEEKGEHGPEGVGEHIGRDA